MLSEKYSLGDVGVVRRYNPTAAHTMKSATTYAPCSTANAYLGYLALESSLRVLVVN